ncbi:hypothetical protein B0H17DRAFT_1134286 [Mycena rosella]|uniref:Uncharacterized protein n=1 Tax=Mycena rosella TaxID=1033263 RepID=A0AAD7DFG8_MYCRO|nr:hypothetical protein B0H17DRAFT_1134286 [Mycena rosella]
MSQTKGLDRGFVLQTAQNITNGNSMFFHFYHPTFTATGYVIAARVGAVDVTSLGRAPKAFGVPDIRRLYPTRFVGSRVSPPGRRNPHPIRILTAPPPPPLPPPPHPSAYAACGERCNHVCMHAHTGGVRSGSAGIVPGGAGAAGARRFVGGTHPNPNAQSHWARLRGEGREKEDINCDAHARMDGVRGRGGRRTPARGRSARAGGHGGG